jgi:hypothetical protein
VAPSLKNFQAVSKHICSALMLYSDKVSVMQ